MGHCPQCGDELPEKRSARSRSASQADESKTSQDDRASSDNLVELYRARNDMEAQVIRGLLESHGVSCVLRGEAVRFTHSITIDGLAEVRILVRPDDLDRAREIMTSSELPGESSPE